MKYPVHIFTIVCNTSTSISNSAAQSTLLNKVDLILVAQSKLFLNPII